MKLLRQTSIVGLVADLQAINGNIGSNTSAITTINGPVTTPGSLLALEKDMKDYADAAVTSVDMSQVTANLAAINLLNSDSATTGSVDHTVAAALNPVSLAVAANHVTALSDIATVQGDIDTLNADENTEGSVDYKIAGVIGGAPAKYDTLGEIGVELDNTNSAVTALVNVIATNKTANEAAQTATNANITTLVNTTIPDAFVAERVVTNTAINDAATALTTSFDSRYFQIANLFSELDTEVKKTTMRTNLGVLSTAETEAYVLAKKNAFHNDSLVVASGTISLGGANALITDAHIQHIRIEYANDEYDELVVRTPAAGAVEVYDAAQNDLDGITVVAKYVSPAL